MSAPFIPQLSADLSVGEPMPLADSIYRYQHIATRDSEHHAACLPGWDQSYSQLDAGTFSGELTDISFSGIQVFRETTNRSVFQQGGPVDDCVVIGMPVDMDGPGLFSGKQFGQHDVFMFNGRQGFTLVTPKRFDVLAVAIPRTELLQLLALEGMDVSVMSHSTVIKPSPGTMNAMKYCLLSIVSAEMFNPAQLSYLQVQRICMSAVLMSSVSAIRSAKPADEPSRCFRSRSHLVREIIDWAMSRQDDPPSMAEICLRFNVGRRVLNYSFAEVVGSSPLTYLRSMRLNGARRDLRRQGHTISVQEIAVRWGFSHLPRFSAEYRKLFGELPSETRQQAG